MFDTIPPNTLQGDTAPLLICLALIAAALGALLFARSKQ